MHVGYAKQMFNYKLYCSAVTFTGGSYLHYTDIEHVNTDFLLQSKLPTLCNDSRMSCWHHPTFTFFFKSIKIDIEKNCDRRQWVWNGLSI